MEKFIEITGLEEVYLVNVSEISYVYFLECLNNKLLCFALKDGTTINTKDLDKYTQLK